MQQIITFPVNAALKQTGRPRISDFANPKFRSVCGRETIAQSDTHQEEKQQKSKPGRFEVRTAKAGADRKSPGALPNVKAPMTNQGRN